MTQLANTNHSVVPDPGTGREASLVPGVSNPAGRPTFSVVVPLFNEVGTVDELGARLSHVMDELGAPCEAILVDDGSTDETFALMLALRRRDPRFKVLSLSRNFGKEVAVTAGLEAASGAAAAVMDGDLQHPPEILHELVSRWRQGYEIVYGVLTDRRGQPTMKRLTTGMFYRVLHATTNIREAPAGGDLRLIDRKALDAFLALRERNRYLRGIWDWIGFRQTGVPYQGLDRYAGRSKYTLRKMMSLGVSAVVSFSDVPLRLALGIGVVVTTASTGLGLATLVSSFSGLGVPAWLPVVLAAAFMLGVQLTVLGVLGEYIGRTYDEVKGRPMYIVREQAGLHRAGASAPGPASVGGSGAP